MARLDIIIISAVLLVAVAAVAAFQFLPFPTVDPNYGTNDVHLTKFSSCNALTRSFDFSGGSGGMFSSRSMGIVAEDSTAPTAAGGEAQKSGSGYSNTNVQVEGVDEADIVKTDGNYIYTLSFGRLTISRAYPIEEAEVLIEKDLGDFYPSEIFLNGDKLVVFGSQYVSISKETGKVLSQDDAQEISDSFYKSCMNRQDEYNCLQGMPLWGVSLSTSKVFDISDKASPVELKSIEIEGSYVSARMIGDNVYFVVSSYPHYAIDYQYVATRSAANAVMPYWDQGAYIFESLPLYRESVSGDEGFTPVCDCADVLKLREDKFNGLTVVASLSLDDLEVNKETIASEYVTVYSSLENMYLAETNYPDYNAAYSNPEQYRGKTFSVNTIIHKFSLNDGNVMYEDSVVVPGVLNNQFAMDESNGYLRVATTTQTTRWWWGPFMEPAIANAGVESSEEVIGSDDDRLEEAKKIEQETEKDSNGVYVYDSGLNLVGKIEGIAPDERIYSTRFIGDRLYMVTFRQVDPFFVIDLSDPSNPSVLGYLKIPGYSTYLHPYDDNTIIGVGIEMDEEASWWSSKLKIALFDVSDFEHPKELQKTVIEGSQYSEALYQHKAFFFDRERNLLAIPVQKYPYRWGGPDVEKGYPTEEFNGVYVYEVTKDGGFELKAKIEHKIGEKYYYSNNIRRTLYIEDVFYTVSDLMIMAHGIPGFEELKTLEFSEPENDGYPYPLYEKGVEGVTVDVGGGESTEAEVMG